MGRLFAGNAVPDLENALTVFELAELKGRGDVQGVVLMLVVFLATQRMYHGPRTRAKAIVIDEAWDLLSGEDSKAFLEGAARRARKYRGALVTGTQSVNDYYANPAARAAWENSDWVIFLAQKDESVELLKAENASTAIRHGAGLEEPDQRRRALCRAGAARPRTAGASRASCSIDGRWRCSPRAAPPSPPSRASRPRAHHGGGHRPDRREHGSGTRRNDHAREGRRRMTSKRGDRSGPGATGEAALAWPDDPETVTVTDIDFEAPGPCARQLLAAGAGGCGTTTRWRRMR